MSLTIIYRVFHTILLMKVTQGVVPIPIKDDLLGPGQCPAGSFCTETSHCTKEYYTTKTGLPFYCGPHQQIDSMICCVSTEAETYMDKLYDSYDESSAHVRSNRSASEDDEVEILSLPYSTTTPIYEETYDLPVPDSNELQGNFKNHLDDFESLLEDVIEPGASVSQQSPQPNARDSVNNEIELELNLNQDQGVQSQSLNSQNPAFETDALPVVVARRGPHQPKSFSQNNEISTRNMRKLESQPGCQCEKGEKGEPGPKGEPGEPGKVVYIPIFVNTVGNNVGLTGGFAGSPIQLGSSPILTPPYQYGQNVAIPQHPNPTVVGYNVPVNLASAQPSSQTGFAATPNPQQYAPPQQQPLVQHSIQQSYSQQSTLPPTIAYADGLQARLQRQTNNKNRKY